MDYDRIKTLLFIAKEAGGFGLTNVLKAAMAELKTLNDEAYEETAPVEPTEEELAAAHKASVKEKSVAVEDDKTDETDEEVDEDDDADPATDAAPTPIRRL